MLQQIELFMDNRRYTIKEKTASHSEPWAHTVPCISNSTMLPRVLIHEVQGNSISMVRALKQIEELLETTPHNAFHTKREADEHAAKIIASLDDIETMLKAIN